MIWMYYSLMPKHPSPFVWFAAVVLAGLSAQQADSSLTKLRKLQLPESPGPVPVIYVPSAEERAHRYQVQVRAAHAWFEEQLHTQVPIVLAVLDKETFGIGGGHWPMPQSEPFSDPGLILFPLSR